MQSFPPTVVLRHRKESLKKCSLSGLESREDFRFFTYPTSTVPELPNHIILSLDAPPLTVEDAPYGLFVMDATWRYAQQMMARTPIQPTWKLRSIPAHFRTAYPRRQTECSDPERGLSSIEAIFVAYHILGRDIAGLFDRYHWGQEFLQKNELAR